MAQLFAKFTDDLQATFMKTGRRGGSTTKDRVQPRKRATFWDDTYPEKCPDKEEPSENSGHGNWVVLHTDYLTSNYYYQCTKCGKLSTFMRFMAADTP